MDYKVHVEFFDGSGKEVPIYVMGSKIGDMDNRLLGAYIKNFHIVDMDKHVETLLSDAETNQPMIDWLKEYMTNRLKDEKGIDYLDDLPGKGE